MARLNSWLSPDVLHALGWALIHSLWQCLGLAALAAALIAISSRPSVRYIVGVSALAAMLSAPVATLFVLMRPAALVHVAPANQSVPPSAQSIVGPLPAASTLPLPAASGPVLSPTRSEGVKAALVLEDFQDRIASLNILPWLVAAWLSGVAFFSLRFAGGFLLLEYKRRQSAILNTGILALCQEVQRQLGLDRAIRYLECSWLQAPAVIGWLRPIVLIPISALTGLTEAQLRAVIAHELAHIRRFDALVNVFQILVETLLFYHPAVWWLNRCIRAERELCCDEIAVAASGSRLEYAQALALMAEWETAPRLAMAANRGPLSERILHILGRKSASAGQRLLGLTGSILFLIAALAAANALFAIASPPIAQAKESVKAVLSASQATVDQLARQVFRPSQMATNIPAPSQTSRSDSTVPEAAPEQAAKDAPAETLTAPSADLTGLLPSETIATPMLVASNAAPVATTNLIPSVLRPVDPEGAPLKVTAPLPRSTQLCTGSNNITGRVISPQAIHLRLGFECIRYNEPVSIPFGFGICPCKGVIMNVQLADLADAEKMQPGKRVTVFGNFQYATIDRVNYLIVKNARINADPFDPPVPPDYRVLVNGLIAKNATANVDTSAGPTTRLPAAMPKEVSAPQTNVASNDPPATPVSPATPILPSGPRATTQAALTCLLGFPPAGCEEVFEPSIRSEALQQTTNCAKEYVQDYREGEVGERLSRKRICKDGPLDRVDYLGANAAGADLYEVQHRNSDTVYVITPPGPDGKISQFQIMRGNPRQIIPSSLVRVTSGIPRPIYRRAATGGTAAPTTMTSLPGRSRQH